MPSTTNTAVEIHPLPGPLGAEVLGLDLAQPLDDATFKRIHRAHLDHHVLVFRGQQALTPAQQVAFSARFGPLQRHVLKSFAHPEQPDILIVSNIIADGKPIGLGDAGHFWHSDLSYKRRPSLGSMLLAQELPSEGGDTLFANQHLAYEQLPQRLKHAVAGRSAQHWYLARYKELQARSPWRPDLSPQQISEVPPESHPIVRSHPETGRPAPRARSASPTSSASSTCCSTWPRSAS